jgi:hypothetical protein
MPIAHLGIERGGRTHRFGGQKVIAVGFEAIITIGANLGEFSFQVHADYPNDFNFSHYIFAMALWFGNHSFINILHLIEMCVPNSPIVCESQFQPMKVLD